MNPYRKNSNELNYFGSDLNKFINEYCSKQMTAINIDLLMFKRSQNHIRIIESKHENENVPQSQLEVLKILSAAEINGYLFSTYIATGNYPYNSTTITNIKTGVTKVFDKNELIRFLEYRNGD